MKKTPRISIERYIVSNNPQLSMQLLKDMGAPKPNNPEEAIALLEQASRKFGDKAFAAMAKIRTPYRDLIMSISESTSECAGGCSKCGTSSATGVELENIYPGSDPMRNQDVVTTTPAPSVAPNPTVLKEPVLVQKTGFDMFRENHKTALAVGGTLAAVGLIVFIAKAVK